MKIFKCLMLFASISFFSLSIFSCPNCEHEYETIELIEASCTKIGCETLKCSLCNKIVEKAILSTGHSLEDVSIIEPATCIDEGKKLQKCKLCNFEVESIIPCLGHSYGDWVTIVEASPLEQGSEIRKCSVCDSEEKKILPSTIYINLDVLTTEVNQTNSNECTTLKEAQTYFDAAIFRYIPSFKLSCKFDYGSQKDLLNTLVDNTSIDVNFSVRITRSASDLTGDTYILNVEYPVSASKKTETEKLYTQYNSVNYIPYESNRSQDFKDFKGLANSKYSCNIDYTDQLVYILERQIVPNVKEGSTLQVVYNKIKDVLREIIDDRMTDYEKVKAIHDYLILNVTYDNELLQLATKGVDDLESYNGFYLEGVFLDQVAVCDGISKAFSVMCNLEGIPCVSIQASPIDGSSNLGHAWNKVFLNGKWYVVDVTSDGVIINQSFEILSYEYFLISSDKLTSRYVEQNYSELICDSNYESYQNIFVTNNGTFYDCYVESFTELVSVIKSFENTDPVNSTVQFYVAFDFGSSIIDELQTAYLTIRKSADFSHIINGNIITIIK